MWDEITHPFRNFNGATAFPILCLNIHTGVTKIVAMSIDCDSIQIYVNTSWNKHQLHPSGGIMRGWNVEFVSANWTDKIKSCKIYLDTNIFEYTWYPFMTSWKMHTYQRKGFIQLWFGSHLWVKLTNDLAIDKSVVGKRDFTIFESRVNFAFISYIATPAYSLCASQTPPVSMPRINTCRVSSRFFLLFALKWISFCGWLTLNGM